MPMRNQMPFLATAALIWTALVAASPVRAEGPLPPFKWTDVDFTADCSPNAGFLRVLRSLNGNHPDANAPPPPVDGPVVDAVAGDTQQSLTLDTPQPWHGLKLTGISVMSGIERGPAAYSLYFEDSIDKVRAVFNQRGWKIPAKENSQEVLDGYASIGLHEQPNQETSVNCSRD